MSEALTVRQVLEQSITELQRAGIDDARRNAEWLLCEIMQYSRAMLYSYPERIVHSDQVLRMQHLLARRVKREPLQYILGHTDFFGLHLRVTPDVLIPRPETEQVVEEALHLIKLQPDPEVLDIGTGSGCIALAIKKERPDAHVTGCDVSMPALELAAKNASLNDLQVNFRQADVLRQDFLEKVPRNLDLIISNPPYVPLRERQSLAPELSFEPSTALFSGNDPLQFYRVILVHALSLLRVGGQIIFETHADFTPGVVTLLREVNFKNVQFKQDLAGLPRIVSGLR